MATRHALDYNDDEDNLLLVPTLSTAVRVAAEALAQALADEYTLDADGEAFTLWVAPDEEGGNAEIVALYPPDDEEDVSDEEGDDEPDDEE